MRKLVLISLILLAAASVWAWGNNPRCPRDGSDSMWTGESFIPPDPPYQILYVYQCYQWQHRFVSPSAPGTE